MRDHWLVLVLLLAPLSDASAGNADAAAALGPVHTRDETFRLVRDDIALEYAECGAYFLLSAEGIRRSLPNGPQREKEVNDWMRLSSNAFERSTALGSSEKTKAAGRLTLENIQRITQRSYENWVIAVAEYGSPAKRPWILQLLASNTGWIGNAALRSDYLQQATSRPIICRSRDST